MNGFWAAVGSGIQAHATPLAIIAMGLLSATIRHMPAKRPRSLDDLWEWLRGSAQEAVNQRGNPTQPGA
jgi:hypothetical protein